MKLSQDQVKTILNNAPASADKKKILDGLINRGYELEGVDTAAAKQAMQPVKTGAVTDIKQAGKGIVEQFKKGAGKVQESIDAFSSGEQGLASTVLQTAGAGASAVSGAAGEAIKGGIKAVLPQGVQETVGNVLETAGEKVAETPVVQNMLAKYEELKRTNPEKARDIAGVLGLGELALDFVTGGTAKTATTATRKATGKAIETAANATTKAVKNAVPKAIETGSDVAMFAAAKTSGLQPDTISFILQNPDKYTDAVKQGITRSGVADDFFTVVQSKLDDVSGAGAGYDAIRQSGARVTAIDPDFLDKFFVREGFNVRNGVVTPTTKSATRDAREIARLQQFYDTWSPALRNESLDAEEILNLRKDIGALSDFDDTGKPAVSEVLARKIYSNVNDNIANKVPGLRELDNQFSPIKKEIEAIKKEFLTKDTDGNYTLKDTAINKIANAKGAGKDKTIARLESYMPGISEKIRVAKVLEDVDFATGRNVGAYLQGGLVAGGLVTGNIPMIVGGMLVANPKLLAKILAKVGKMSKNSTIKATDLANKIRSGAKLTTEEASMVKSISTLPKEDILGILGGAGAVGIEQELTSLEQ